MDFFQNIDFSKFKRIKIDVGLSYNAPQAGNWLDQNHDDLLVIGFEPNPECVTGILSKNIQKRQPYHGNPIKDEYIGNQFHLIPVALENISESTSMKFYIMKNDCGTSSLYEPSPNLNDSVKTEVFVPVYPLSFFLEKIDWSRFEYIEYLKIDAQGADLNILKSAGEYIKKIVFVTAEPDGHQYKGAESCTAIAITQYMESQDFVRIQHPGVTDPTFLNKKFLHLMNSIYICQL